MSRRRLLLRCCATWATILTVLLLVSSAKAQTAHRIAQSAFSSVVLLTFDDVGGKPISLGSGFFVRPGIVATNLHVIEGATTGQAKVVGQKATYEIEGVVALDRQHDLALLKVTGTRAAALPLGDADRVVVGDDVYVLGNPRGLEGTLSPGIVSAIRGPKSERVIQITAPISPGGSGGPVLNNRAEVIGIAFATLRDGQNLNFAVPVNYLKALLTQVGRVTPLARAPSELGRTSTELPIEILSTTKGDVVLVPAGEFWMGDNDRLIPTDPAFRERLKKEGINPDEMGLDWRAPKRRVYLGDVFVDKYEVTNSLFKRFVADGGYGSRELWSAAGWRWRTEQARTEPHYWGDPERNAPKQPVVGVTWYEAEAFCRFVGKRLPTEAEWEKAARGPDGRLYPWGNEWDSSRANSGEKGLKAPTTPAAVGSYPQGISPYGAHDMAGNVWEWVADWYGRYPRDRGRTTPDPNPLGPSSGAARIIRGGAIDFNPVALTTVNRSGKAPEYDDFYTGIRCAKDVE